MSGTRAAIYARFSSHNQRDESIEIQVENCRAYCAERGFTVVREYCDYAVSGTTAERAQFQRMLADAGMRLFDYVVIYKVTRIMRNRDEMAVARITLRRHHVEILYAGEQIVSGSSGVLQLGMLEVLAEWESAQMSERIRDGIRKNAERCMANGRPLYGWDIVDGSYQVNEVEARALRTARDMLFAGSTMAECVRALAGHRTKRGAAITQAALTKMLRRPQNAGTYRYSGVEVEGGMPALWSRTDQARLDELLGHPRPRRTVTSEDYPLTGRLFHDHDGELVPMTGYSGKSKGGALYSYYRCRRCRKYLRRDLIEREVADAVIAELSDEALRERVADMICACDEDERGPRQSEVLERELHDIELAYGRIWDAIESGMAPPGGAERIDALRARQATLEDQLAAARAVESARLDRDRVLFWLECIGESTPEEIIRVFVSRVIVREDGTTVDMWIGERGQGDAPAVLVRGSCESSPAPPAAHCTNTRAVYATRRGLVIWIEGGAR
jgi:site-specific DNA recombinase